VVPFPPQKPKPFDRAAVAAVRAGVVGCYGLFCRDRWIYIGGGDIRERLLAHLDGERPWAATEQPTHWVSVEAADYDALTNDLVLACSPVGNPPATAVPAPSQSASSRRQS
jgi:hypothetical protein